MWASLIVVFREVLEAGLIIGVVLAATQGVAKRTRWVAYGILGGVLGAGVLALFAGSVSNALDGMGQELFNAGVLALAVAMLTWHVVWMARHGRELVAQMKHVGAEVKAGRQELLALAIVVGVAVLREGAETVLFMYGIAVTGNSTASIFTGGILGLVAGAAVSALMYFGLLRIPTRYLFQATSWIITLLAAGLASQSIFYLQQAQVVEVLGDTLWDSSALLADDSALGMVLKTLIGYTAQPSGLQVAVYAATILVIFILSKRYGGTSPKQRIANA